MQLGLLRLSAMGDAILWSSLLEQCQRRYPDVHLTWITSPHWQALFPGLTSVRWLSVKKPAGLRDYWHLWHQLRGEHFEVLLCGQASLRTNLIYPLISASKKIGFDALRGREGHRFISTNTISYQDNHLLEGFAQFFEAAGLPLDLKDLHWPVEVTPEANAFAKSALPAKTPLLGLVLSASKAERTWPISHELSLISHLIHHTDIQIVLIGGSTRAELAIAKAITDWQEQSAKATNRITNLVAKTDLNTLCGVLKHMHCVVSPDTGPAHLAHALGTPVIGLYAVARAALSGPYQSPYTIDAYSDAAKHCGFGSADQLGWHQRIHHPRAMSVIRPEQVVAAIEQVLNR